MAADNERLWNEKLWDVVNHLYWSPKFIGLVSIQDQLDKTSSGDFIVPKRLLSGGKSLYVRSSRFDLKELRKKEELLNAFFNITFAIAPGEVVNKLLCTRLGINDNGPFRSYGGREIPDVFGWGQENVTQPDGFFGSEKSLIGVELKLAAHTSIEQVAKYVALMVWEQQGQRKDLVAQSAPRAA